jgi:hypothetical protein
VAGGAVTSTDTEGNGDNVADAKAEGGTPGKPPRAHSVEWNVLLPSAKHCTNVDPAGKVAASTGTTVATITARLSQGNCRYGNEAKSDSL